MSSGVPQTKCPLWKSAAGSIRSGPDFSLRWCALVTLCMTCHVWQIAKSRMILFPSLLNRSLFVRLNLSTFMGHEWGRAHAAMCLLYSNQFGLWNTLSMVYKSLEWLLIFTWKLWLQGGSCIFWNIFLTWHSYIQNLPFQEYPCLARHNGT